ncbi:MAG: hypothetical protein C4617_02215 [Candidatus Liberibacter europaeus]|uniref:DUF177 domain-containing protein n=1 Tax=Candidatus Liberibacter europaeus TaxID=744859 RepID=A0A2T4VXZ8_9HYPH|nr:hypothetical protein [Candidatus Liberibacter europaeus]PTL86653.1 MAG: hypothetical protein C4617_02215 [Candidatus Liberibacter europaeus]
MGKCSEITEIFSHIINIKPAFSAPMQITVKGNGIDCEKLARQWEVPSVDSFYADIKLSKWKRIGVYVEGKVFAKITQVCVITLESVVFEIEESIGCILVPDSSKLLLPNDDCSGKKRVVEVRGPDFFAFSSDGMVDIGAVVANFVAVAINPYPKKEGAVFSDVYDNVTNNSTPVSFCIPKGGNEN